MRFGFGFGFNTGARKIFGAISKGKGIVVASIAKIFHQIEATVVGTGTVVAPLHVTVKLQAVVTGEGTVEAELPSYDLDALNYFNRNGGLGLSDPAKALFNQLFIDAKDGGYLPTDRFTIRANENILAACTNLINDNYTSTLVNSPTFVAKQYIQPDGVSSYIDSNYAPDDGLLDDAAFGVCQKNNASVQSAAITAHGANRSASNQRNFLLPNNAGTLEGNINGQANTAAIQSGLSTEVGQSTIARISSSQIQGGKDGNWGTPVNETSTSLESDNMYEGAVNNAGSAIFFSNAQIQYSFNSSGWTEAKDLALYNRMEIFLSDMAAL